MKRCRLRTLYFAMIDAFRSKGYVRYQTHSELLGGASPLAARLAASRVSAKLPRHPLTVSARRAG